MGVIFRAALVKDPTKAKTYAGLSRFDAAQWRADWAKKELQTFRDEKIYKKSWRRVDTTRGDYLSASQLVTTDGGWSDPEAVAGAQCLIEKAIAMGDPWTRIHPQTKRLLFLKLNFSYQEEFEQCWSHFRTEISDGKNDKKLTDGKEDTKLTDGKEDKKQTDGKEGKKQTGGKAEPCPAQLPQQEDEANG